MTGQATEAIRTGSPAPERNERPVRLSLSEIEALGTKAARGAGFEWGLAEEAGWATARLAELGLRAPELLLKLLEGPRGGATRPATDGCWRGVGALCPILAGAALADHAVLPEGRPAGRLDLGPVRCPALLLPFAARATRRRGDALLVRAGEAAALVRPQQPPVLLHPTAWNAEQPEAVTLALAVGIPAVPPALAPEQHVPYALWLRLDRLALRTTVPPSARSRAGAGAAGKDDD